MNAPRRSGQYSMRVQAADLDNNATGQQVAVTAGSHYVAGAWVNIPTTADAVNFAVRVAVAELGGQPPLGPDRAQNFTAHTGGAWTERVRHLHGSGRRHRREAAPRAVGAAVGGLRRRRGRPLQACAGGKRLRQRRRAQFRRRRRDRQHALRHEERHRVHRQGHELARFPRRRLHARRQCERGSLRRRPDRLAAAQHRGSQRLRDLIGGDARHHPRRRWP